MKKIFGILTIAVLMLMTAMPAQAQFMKWGFKGGVNLSELSVSGDLKNNFKKSNTTGYFIGPMAEITVPIIGLGVDGALLYSHRGSKQDGLSIPVNLKYTFGLGSTLGFYLAAGPDFFFNFKENSEVVDLTGGKVHLDKKKAQVGLNLGAGVKILSHWQLGVNYQIPLGDSFSLESAVSGAGTALKGDAKTKTWQVSLAYLF